VGEGEEEPQAGSRRTLADATGTRKKILFM
jgi:hypothetical protein